MKQIFFFLLIVTLVPVASQAQLGGFANRVNNKVKSKVNQRIDNKVDRAIDKGLDEAEGKGPSKASPAKTANTSNTAEEPATTSNSKNEVAMTSFSRYDFIPGDQILFYENFEQEAIGELPTGWNTSGSGEVVSLPNIPGKWLKLHKQFVYLSSNEKALPENYTVEFDVVMQLKNNGWMFPTFSFGLISTANESTTGNNFLREFRKYASVVTEIYPAIKTSRVSVQSHSGGNPWFHSEPKTLATLDDHYGTPIHIAIQVQKERYRLWINEEKSFDVPKGVPLGQKMNQFLFQLGHTNYAESDYGIYVSNIKAATGKPDTRHKLVEEGSFSTSAILFDVNAATIRPESAGVLKEIAAVLKENPSMKIRIIGHTDSDGSDANNLLLSQNRAAAVKTALINEFGIDGEVMQTDGKGETKAIADNKTKEGRAANRRVEFIKL